jgi:hypothetical protein
MIDRFRPLQRLEHYRRRVFPPSITCPYSFVPFGGNGVIECPRDDSVGGIWGLATLDAISDAGVGILAVEEGLVEVFAAERRLEDDAAHSSSLNLDALALAFLRYKNESTRLPSTLTM